MLISRQRGVTLLELLVVMVLLAIISTLIMQGLSVALSTYEKVRQRQYEGGPRMLASSWYTESVAGIEAQLDAERQFKGDSSSMSGISHSTLVGRNGQVQPIAWRISQMSDGSVELQYQELGIAWTVARWPAGSKAHFIYRDHDGTPQKQWPPSDKLVSLVPDGRVPSAVLFEVTFPSRPPLRWYVSILGRRLPRYDYRDL